MGEIDEGRNPDIWLEKQLAHTFKANQAVRGRLSAMTVQTFVDRIQLLRCKSGSTRIYLLCLALRALGKGDLRCVLFFQRA